MWTSTAAAVAYVTVAGGVDAALGERLVLIGLLGIGPFLAAVRSTPRATTAVGVYAVAVAIALGVPDELWGELDHLSRIATVTASAAVAVAFARLRVQREEALRRVAHVADVAQRAIVREPPPVLGPVAIAARYLSAAREASIGGDLYEATFTPSGVRLIVGDARGKGLTRSIWRPRCSAASASTPCRTSSCPTWRSPSTARSCGASARRSSSPPC